MSPRVDGEKARLVRAGAALGVALLLAHCSNSNVSSRIDPRYGVAASPRVVEPGEPVPKGGGAYRVGKPYMVGGRFYYPDDNKHYRAEGTASWYGSDFHGRLTANGEVYDLEGISAAHPTMPLPSYARVTNIANGRSLIVRVNDRGPYHGNRVIDVSVKAAHLLGFRRSGTARVRVEYVGPAPLEGSDDRVLEATLRQDRPAPAPVLVASRRQIFPNQPAPAERAFVFGGPAARRVGEPTADKLATEASLEQPRSGPLAFAPAGVDGTAQFMSGRGLY